MCIVDSGMKADYRGAYFVAFQLLVNMTLFNIFIGMVIGISLEYFKQELEKKEARGKEQTSTDLNVSVRLLYFKINNSK